MLRHTGHFANEVSPGARLLPRIAGELYDWTTAEREARRAIALDSLSPIAYWRLGFIIGNQGRMAEALPAFRRARELDPLSPINLVWEGIALAATGRFDEGVAKAVRAHELAPTVPTVQTMMLSTLIFAGRNREAAERAAVLVARARDPLPLGSMARALAVGGRTREATRAAQQLEQTGDDMRGVWYGRFLARLALGDTSGALAAVEAAAAGDGDLLPSVVLANPFFDPIRTTPRFRAAMRRYHLEQSPLVQPNGGRPR